MDWCHSRTAIAVFNKLAGKVERLRGFTRIIMVIYAKLLLYSIGFGNDRVWLRGYA